MIWQVWKKWDTWILTETNTKVLLEPAYILHLRAYSETSALVEFFTLSKGRITAIAKGAKRKHSPFKSFLHPFCPVLISWASKHELKTLTHIEVNPHTQADGIFQRIHLTKDALLSGLYLNELLMRLLTRFDPHADLFKIYETTLQQLSQSSIKENTDKALNNTLAALRVFEKVLLASLGYGLNLKTDVKTGLPIEASLEYGYHPELGCFKLMPGDVLNRHYCLSVIGESLIQLEKGVFTSKSALDDAKRLLRYALDFQLDGAVLHSRRAYFKGQSGVKINETEIARG